MFAPSNFPFGAPVLSRCCSATKTPLDSLFLPFVSLVFLSSFANSSSICVSHVRRSGYLTQGEMFSVYTRLARFLTLEMSFMTCFFSLTPFFWVLSGSSMKRVFFLVCLLACTITSSTAESIFASVVFQAFISETGVFVLFFLSNPSHESQERACSWWALILR